MLRMLSKAKEVLAGLRILVSAPIPIPNRHQYRCPGPTPNCTSRHATILNDGHVSAAQQVTTILLRLVYNYQGAVYV